MTEISPYEAMKLGFFFTMGVITAVSIMILSVSYLSNCIAIASGLIKYFLT